MRTEVPLGRVTPRSRSAWYRRISTVMTDAVSGSRVYDVLQQGLGGLTDDPVDDRAILEEHDRRDRPDRVASRQPGVLVDVHPHQCHPTLRGLGQLLEDRRHGPAWPAPLSREVDYQETPGRDQRLIEALLGQVDRLGHSVIPGRARTHP